MRNTSDASRSRSSLILGRVVNRSACEVVQFGRPDEDRGAKALPGTRAVSRHFGSTPFRPPLGRVVLESWEGPSAQSWEPASSTPPRPPPPGLALPPSASRGLRGQRPVGAVQQTFVPWVLPPSSADTRSSSSLLRFAPMRVITTDSCRIAPTTSRRSRRRDFEAKLDGPFEDDHVAGSPEGIMSGPCGGCLG